METQNGLFLNGSALVSKESFKSDHSDVRKGNTNVGNRAT